MIKKLVFLPIYCLLLFVYLNNPVLCAETAYKTKNSYLNARNSLIDSAKKLRFDSAIVLSTEEQKADTYLSELRKMEFERNKDYFPPAHNFYEAKPYIDNSPLLEVFHKMPKGAILHLHPPAMGDFRWLISYSTYLPNCYVYTGSDTDTLETRLIIGAILNLRMLTINFSSNNKVTGVSLVDRLVRDRDKNLLY